MIPIPGLSKGSLSLYAVLDKGHRFVRSLYGGWLVGVLASFCQCFWASFGWFCQRVFWKAFVWVCRPFNDSFRIIELLAILIAITAFFLELGNRKEEREARAWQLLTARASGNSGKIWALEYLNREERPMLSLDWKLWPQFSFDIQAFSTIDKFWGVENRERSLFPMRGERKGYPLLAPKWWPLNKERIALRGIDLTPPDLAKSWEGKSEDERLLPEHGCGQRTYLRGIGLSLAELQSAILVCSDLRGADLQGAHLEGADLRGADFSLWFREKTYYQNVYEHGRELKPLPALLQGANFREARLDGANFRGAQLQGADLRGANLEGVDFSKPETTKDPPRDSLIYLIQKHTQGLLVHAADLEGADLRQAKGLSCSQLTQALRWEEAYRDDKLACDKEIPDPPAE